MTLFYSRTDNCYSVTKWVRKLKLLFFKPSYSGQELTEKKRDKAFLKKFITTKPSPGELHDSIGLG